MGKKWKRGLDPGVVKASVAFVAPQQAVCPQSLPPQAGRTEQSLKQKVWTTHPLSVHRGEAARYSGKEPEAPLRGRESIYLPENRAWRPELCLLGCRGWAGPGQRLLGEGSGLAELACPVISGAAFQTCRGGRPGQLYPLLTYVFQEASNCALSSR